MHVSLHAYFYRCVCMHPCKEASKRSWRTDRQRAVGIRVHAGSWAVQLVHSVSGEPGRDEREVEEKGGREGVREGCCQSRPCGKTPWEEEEDTQQAAREQY